MSSNTITHWEDTEIVEEGKGRACMICGGLVTPAHRYCGWHEWKRKMSPPPLAWERIVQGFIAWRESR